MLHKSKLSFYVFKWIGSLLLFCGILWIFLFGFKNLEYGNSRESLSLAKKAVDHALVTCYAIEGCYPPSFEYLEKNYNIHIDSKKYRVDYQIFASNIKPSVQIIPIKNSEKEHAYEP